MVVTDDNSLVPALVHSMLRPWVNFSNDYPPLHPFYKSSPDFYETKTHVIVRANLPGVDKSEIKMYLEDRVLKIDAEHKEVFDSEDSTSSFSSFSFHRAIALPRTADLQKFDASLDKGVLTVKFEKASSPSSREITIH